MSAPKNLAQEILALRRIAGYQGENLDWRVWDAGVVASDGSFTIEIDGGELKAEIDLYSHNLPDGQDFDFDAWKAERLELHMKPASRKGFSALYRIVRILLSGGMVSFKDGQLDQNHLDPVRKRNLVLGFEVSFHDDFIQIDEVLP